MSPVRRIGLSFGHLRTFNDGIGELALQLGHGLAQLATRLRDEHALELHYHLPQRLHGYFGSTVAYRATGDLQRLVHIGRPRFDLWHSLHQFNPFQPPLGARAVLQTILDLNFMHVGSPRKRHKYLRRMQSLARRSAAIVTISEFVRGDLLRHLGEATPVKVIPLAARDLSHLPPVAVPIPRSRYLLHVSRMAPTKNVTALLDMAKIWPEMGFVLAGAASPYSRVISESVKQQQLDNVLVHEDISDAQKAWLFSHCEAFLFPSLTEGFGLPPLEAMHFGKPVFLARRTSLPEVGGHVARYWDEFEPGNMKQLVQHTLASFGADDARRTREHAATFSWARCTQQHAALYVEMLRQTPR